MKTLFMTIIVVFLASLAVFGGWFVHYENNMTVTDELSYWYSTEVRGISEEDFIVDQFINDVTDFWEDLTK